MEKWTLYFFKEWNFFPYLLIIPPENKTLIGLIPFPSTHKKLTDNFLNYLYTNNRKKYFNNWRVKQNYLLLSDVIKSIGVKESLKQYYSADIIRTLEIPAISL